MLSYVIHVANLPEDDDTPEDDPFQEHIPTPEMDAFGFTSAI